MRQFCQQIGEIVIHLLGTEIRMEPTAMQIASALLERVGLFSDDFVKQLLF